MSLREARAGVYYVVKRAVPASERLGLRRGVRLVVHSRTLIGTGVCVVLCDTGVKLSLSEGVAKRITVEEDACETETDET